MNTYKLCLVFSLIFYGSLSAQWSIKGDSIRKEAKWFLQQKFTDDEWEASNFATDQELKWFKDARYGMFIHFGLSTYIGKDLSWGMCYTRKAPDGMGGGHGPIADSVWVKYPEKFVFADFDARKWVEIAKQAGMKYIVTIAKHHDGFHLWDTNYSDFKVTNTPFGRDYLKEIAEACHEAGMKFGVYYSQRDWYHPDYQPVDTSLIKAKKIPPYYEPRVGVSNIKPGPRHQKYIDYQFNVVRELCTNYGKIDVFWFDASWWGGMFTADMWESEKLSRMIRELQPGVIINNRASIPGDFDTPEQKIGMYQERAWESCLTLNSTWSWSDTPMKSKKQLIKIITSTAIGNGNALLSWGPQWNGAFDPAQVVRLREIGDWLNLYGHTIYNTRGGPWYPDKWGGSTYRKNKVWLHMDDIRETNLLLPKINNKLIAATSITGGEVMFDQNRKGEVEIDMQHINLDSISNIIELTFADPINEMVENKYAVSLFQDPMFGTVISNNASLKLSSHSELDVKENHALLFQNIEVDIPYTFHTKEENRPFSVIDLGKTYSVKGIEIRNKKNYTSDPGVFKIQISTDGTAWETIEEKKEAFDVWEVVVKKFNAGIELPGIPARYVRVIIDSQDNAALHLQKILVYGE